MEPSSSLKEEVIRMSQSWLLSGYGIMYSEPCYAYFGCQQVLLPPPLRTPSLHPADPNTVLWATESAGGWSDGGSEEGASCPTFSFVPKKKRDKCNIGDEDSLHFVKRCCTGWRVFGCKFWCNNNNKKKTHVSPRCLSVAAFPRPLGLHKPKCDAKSWWWKQLNSNMAKRFL